MPKLNTHTIFIVFLGLFCTGLVAVGFLIIGTPVSMQLRKKDEERIAHFSAIRYAIEDYYRVTGRLPETLASMNQETGMKTYNPYHSLVLQDPYTQKPYEYVVTSTQTYDLCTEFETDTTLRRGSETPAYYPSYSNEHKKGYFCIKNTLPPYLFTSTPTIKPIITSKTEVSVTPTEIK